jgi:hypothetical protein
MKSAYITNIRKWSVIIYLVLSWVPNTKAAQFVEAAVEMEGMFWSRQGTESRRIYTTRCVVGTNTWLLEGDFARNSTTTYWFTGTNSIKHTVITKKLPELRPEDRQEPVTRIPEIGERFTEVRSLSDGGPTDAGGYENVLWLAFCSGNYLKKDGQRTGLPIGVNARALYAQDYSQTISLFEDSLALPKRVELHTPDKHLLCHYEVEQSTNFLGWSFPQRFKVIQYRPRTKGGWEPHAEAVGRLISARSVGEPEIPADVLKQIKQ